MSMVRIEVYRTAIEALDACIEALEQVPSETGGRSVWDNAVALRGRLRRLLARAEKRELLDGMVRLGVDAFKTVNGNPNADPNIALQPAPLARPHGAG